MPVLRRAGLFSLFRGLDICNFLEICHLYHGAELVVGAEKAPFEGRVPGVWPGLNKLCAVFGQMRGKGVEVVRVEGDVVYGPRPRSSRKSVRAERSL